MRDYSDDEIENSQGEVIRDLTEEIIALQSRIEKAEALLRYSIDRFYEMGYRPRTLEQYFSESGKAGE